MPMPYVLFERIKRGEIEAATKPPDRLLPSFSAMKKRTLAWLVGTYGLCGWITSDTPMASNRRPASSGRWAVAEAGMASP